MKSETRVLPIIIATFLLQLGCSGEFWFDTPNESRGAELGATYSSTFAVSPEEGKLSHHEDDVAAAHARDIRGVGARMIRLQFCGWVADTGEIEAGQLTRLRRMISFARDAGLKIYAQLNYCTVVPSGYDVAEWKKILDEGGALTVKSQAAWHEGFRDDATGNDYSRDFADATRAFAREFARDVDYWEVWNEPNGALSGHASWDETCTSGNYGVGGGANWSLCPKQLGVITRKVGEVLAQEDPGARVVAGNVLFHGSNYSVAKDYWRAVYDSAAVQEFRQANGRFPWHVVGIHPYGVPAYVSVDDENQQNGLREQVEDFRTYMPGDSSPLAITEYGWTTDLGHDDARVIANEQEQAYHVREIYPLAHELGLEFVMWFNMRDSDDGDYRFGIQRSDRTFKTAGKAYCEASRTSNCPAGGIDAKPGSSGRVGSRPNGISDPAIASCHSRNGASGEPLGNGGGPHVHRWGRGWVQDFRDPVLGDTICMRADTRTEAWMVRGAIRDAYFGAGGGPGKLGYPVTDEQATDAGPFQQFQHGHIKWSHAAGTFAAFDHAGNPI